MFCSPLAVCLGAMEGVMLHTLPGQALRMAQRAGPTNAFKLLSIFTRKREIGITNIRTPFQCSKDFQKGGSVFQSSLCKELSSHCISEA